MKSLYAQLHGNQKFQRKKMNINDFLTKCAKLRISEAEFRKFGVMDIEVVIVMKIDIKKLRQGIDYQRCVLHKYRPASCTIKLTRACQCQLGKKSSFRQQHF